MNCISVGHISPSSWTSARLVWLVWCSILFYACSGMDYELYSARVVIKYTNHSDHITREFPGRFGVTSPTKMEVGKVVHVLTQDSMNHGCEPAVNAPATGHWIALIQRGRCKFERKIKSAVHVNNASAVVIYNHEEEDTLITMDHRVDSVVSVFIHKKDGEVIADLVDNNITVMMNISTGEVLTVLTINENGTQTSNISTVKNINLLIISLSFVLLLIIGLVCLLVYTVKRNKYMQAKNRARDMIFTVNTSPDGKEARVRLLTSYSNQNAVLPSIVEQQIPMHSQDQRLRAEQPDV